MTKGDPVDHLFQELTIADAQKQQQQQKPFQVVLVDIGEAARREIHCTETPLEECAEELSFVALSYRWGEVQEQVVDTELGYLASITSFALDDFYDLCSMMRKEPNLKSIKYVWVDAICVDQTNYERRKATIHQMSNIYEKAAYILAVPDLHKRHLMNVSSENSKIGQCISDNSKYIYHLIQGNTEQLVDLDNEFLDKSKVPENRTLRQLLANYTAYLSHGLTTTLRQNLYNYDSEKTLDMICESYEASLANSHENLDCIKNRIQYEDCRNRPLDDLLAYYKVAGILEQKPYGSIYQTGDWCPFGTYNRIWTHELIRRGNNIRQAMKFLEDLISDWSTRVWVISEYHIAKKKNNLKYWFIELSNPDNLDMTELPFFKFDFTNPAFSSVVGNRSYDNYVAHHNNATPADVSFHSMLIKQLNTQTFLEMMLKSKASKNQDRFYAILPQSKYKDKLNQVGHWEINTMMSVKLKLFEIMDTNDKWDLFFLSGNIYSSNTYKVLPTFVASDIHWPYVDSFVQDRLCNFDTNLSFRNFDTNGSFPITLRHNSNLRLNYLQLAPTQYYELPKDYTKQFISNNSQHQKTLFNHLKLDKHCLINMVLLFQYHRERMSLDSRLLGMPSDFVTLIGSYKENKWTLCCIPTKDFKELWGSYNNTGYGTVFNIY
ncbi:hypothetical protein BCR42DRAFT_495927 [Absidia repens]|uniref:Heterokaryon incompatibility domain-containing protein n=1 Tax=Absidia repens TaxID=90262 RepID=A0A1X2I1Q9_9FUNG|nr:hypothetical protein BCR42DRAFT_495927 [Absidia repens]